MRTDILKFNENVSIRMQMIKGEPWFIAKDVCNTLGIANNREAVSKLRETETGVVTTDVRSENGVIQKREMATVNESGLYSLIFQSRKPAAQDFRYWVTSEVLPSIRKYGKYTIPGSKEQLRLEAKLKRNERTAWLNEIARHLTSVDHRNIARKLHCKDWEVRKVLAGWKQDTTIESECVNRASLNAQLRQKLDNSDFRNRIMDEITKK